MGTLKTISIAVVLAALIPPALAAGAATRTVTCESDHKRRNYCRVPVPHEAALLHQHSSAACTYAITWGYDARGVWVDKGCRAEFAIR